MYFELNVAKMLYGNFEQLPPDYISTLVQMKF